MGFCVYLPAFLRRYCDGETLVALDGPTDADAALRGLAARFPALGPRLFDGHGRLHAHLVVVRNDRRVASAALAETAMEDGDRLELVGLAGGGAPDERPAAAGSGDSAPRSLPARDADVRMRGFRRRSAVEDAQKIALANAAPPRIEEVPVEGCAGRVLAEDIRSPVSLPPFRRSMMDGYAVRATETFGAGPYAPATFLVIGESLPGREASLPPIGAGRALRIMTGAPVPEDADAVVKAEDTRAGRMDAEIEVLAPIAAGKNIGEIGEDVQAGERVLARGRVLRPQDAGLLSSLGVSPVTVYARPRIRLLVSGQEILPPGQAPRGAQIVDANTPMLRALLRRDGAELTDLRRVPDRRDALEAALLAPGVDLVLTTGGTSVGQEDFLPLLVHAHGELWVHGIACRPAAPTGVGRIGDARIVLLPGNPVACLCAYDLIAGPLVRALGGRAPGLPYPRITAPLARKLSSALGRLDYARVALLPDGGVDPIAISGSSILSSTTRASGFVLIPAGDEGYPAGARVTVHLYDAPPGGELTP